MLRIVPTLFRVQPPIEKLLGYLPDKSFFLFFKKKFQNFIALLIALSYRVHYSLLIGKKYKTKCTIREISLYFFNVRLFQTMQLKKCSNKSANSHWKFFKPVPHKKSRTSYTYSYLRNICAMSKPSEKWFFKRFYQFD